MPTCAPPGRPCDLGQTSKSVGRAYAYDPATPALQRAAPPRLCAGGSRAGRGAQRRRGKREFDEGRHTPPHCARPPHAEATKLLFPNPVWMGGPDLWYLMAFVDTMVEQSLISSVDTIT
jgi:hypothetical protein